MKTKLPELTRANIAQWQVEEAVEFATSVRAPDDVMDQLSELFDVLGLAALALETFSEQDLLPAFLAWRMKQASRGRTPIEFDRLRFILGRVSW